jgi:hypothetical protein
MSFIFRFDEIGREKGNWSQVTLLHLGGAIIYFSESQLTHLYSGTNCTYVGWLCSVDEPSVVRAHF